VLVLVALLSLAGHAANCLLPVVALPYGITRPLTGRAFASVLPELVPPAMLTRANTMEVTSTNGASIVGPGLAAVIDERADGRCCLVTVRRRRLHRTRSSAGPPPPPRDPSHR
jgi:hypothetical protein